MVLVSPWPRSHTTPPYNDPGVAISFDYEDLSDAQFETLVVFLCQRLRGSSVQGFAKGQTAGVTQCLQAVVAAHAKEVANCPSSGPAFGWPLMSNVGPHDLCI